MDGIELAQIANGLILKVFFFVPYRHSKQAAASAVKDAPASSKKSEFVVENYEDALTEAKRITEEKGISSPEAALAWELVEELSATKSHHETTGSG